MAHLLATFHGPGGSIERSALVDTGASQAILGQSDARAIGLVPYRTAHPMTDNGQVSWPEAMGAVEIDGLSKEVPIWIAPNGTETTVGEHTLAELGYVIVAPGKPGHQVREIAAAAQEELHAYNRPPPTAPVAALSSGLRSYRRAVCDACEMNTGGILPRCRHCGCPIATRVLLSGTGGCPEGKW
jgi:predicted aspartyl protease